MPKSTRCGACNQPIKGHHRRRDGGKACCVVNKIKKQGTRKPPIKDCHVSD